MAAALHSFQQAVRLNPNNSDYSLALIVTREGYVTELVQRAAQARSVGNTALSDSLLSQARTLDPNNHVVLQHFEATSGAGNKIESDTKKPGPFYSSIDPSKFPAQNIASTLQGPVELTPTPGNRDVHLHGDVQSVVRNLYSLFGIKVAFDASVTSGAPINLDMNNVTFAGATRALGIAAKIFAVPVQPTSVLVARDTQENRDELTPLVEETVYLPGRTNDEMQELANVARNIFDIKEVTASSTGGFLLLRGNEQVLREVNAVYDDMLDGNPEVLFDVSLYELDKTLDNNIGAVLPNSAGVFSIAAQAQSLVSANQALINQAVAAGLLTLNGTPLQNLITEVGFLVASGAVTAVQYTNLLGVFGGGLTFAGLYLGSSASFNMALNSTDVSILDSAQMRAINKQPATFRVGSRYPVITGTYSSGGTSTLASSLSGLNINGTSVSSLLSQFLGASSVSVPQFQYEDLGITLNLTPQILRNDTVSLALKMNVEALAGNSINNIPILDNRALTSTITVPAGQTAMLSTLVSSSEMKALTGLPGLNDIPGFQGTSQDRQKSSTALLITITPHIVRSGRLEVSSRRIDTARGSGAVGVE
ncbi:type II secretion system protein GspD [Granulicella sp. L46]|uniref:type II secretion system protein GspD n=1 Tax=Granulicella sp. L46 TaxID=1641865 RepID=UPI001C2071C5|nr:type II and III secretion system protein [Granulicella sp. L46]